MSYCINPLCTDRISAHNLDQCPACLTHLTIHGRYRILHPLCERQDASSEIFCVVDIGNPELLMVLKTLIQDDSKLQSLFQREQTLLMQVDHQGIPRGYDTFSLSINQHQIIHCLVMEYIAGENLQQWVENHGAISLIEAIDWLKQLLNTLNYIHQQKVFHRDIKPSNIMRKNDGSIVLIDFGSTTQVTHAILGDTTNTTIVSYGYTAPEQLRGKAVPQSDFYALGKTLMYLLMGKNVDSHQSFMPAQPIPLSFHKLLQEMTDDVAKRPKNIKNILHRLRKIEREDISRKRKQIGLGFLAGALCSGIILMPLMRQINWNSELNRLFSHETCDKQQNNNISCGEQSLMNESEESSIALAKKNGIKYFNEKNWQEAGKSLKEVFDKIKDPEALIYLNNLQIHSSQKPYYTIAVVAPLKGAPGTINKGLNILRGVAMAQKESLDKGLRLQVIIADDHNNPDDAEKLAQELVQRREIIAVIGHNVSDATKAALKIYDHNRMVLISATSTSEELSTYASREKNSFFRVVPADGITANKIAGFLQNSKIKRVAVFYNPTKSYSSSLAEAFKKVFTTIGDNDIIESPQFNLVYPGSNDQSFNAEQAVKKAIKDGAKAFVVIPDSSEKGASAMLEVRELIRYADNNNIPIFTGDTMAGEDLGEIKKTKVVIASNWEANQDLNSPIIKFWQAKSGKKAALTWQAFTTYNAAQVIITAMNDLERLDRVKLREKIAAPNFYALSTSGKIKFYKGELQEPKILLTCYSAISEKNASLDLDKSSLKTEQCKTKI
jgi:eukaryotic-like serine/threonine-protein kinase